MFTTDAIVRAALKDHLNIALQIDLVSTWDSIITRGHRAAYNLILRSWLRRGYTKAHIDQWDFGLEYEIEISVWWCLTHGASVQPESYDDRQLVAQRLDRRKELDDETFLVVGGELIVPDNTFGQVTTGPYDTTGDMFVEDTEDVRRGQTTEF